MKGETHSFASDKESEFTCSAIENCCSLYARPVDGDVDKASFVFTLLPPYILPHHKRRSCGVRGFKLIPL